MSPTKLAILGLLLLNLVVFLPVRHHECVALDDEKYVTQNRHVQQGISASSVRWAFQTGYFGNWHPLTWLSLMLDRTLYGDWPGGYHVTNLALHLIGVLALFAAILKLSNAPVASFCVAALYSLHPLHVESVAWVAERKGILSSCLGLLALMFYSHWQRTGRRWIYILVIVSYAASLLAKQMLVTLPLLLLLLDYWPLQRKFAAKLIVEKLPLVAIAAIFSVIAFWTQQFEGALATVDELPLLRRFDQAAWNVFAYLGLMVWPKNLAVFYPYSREPQSIASTICVLAALIGVSLLFVIFRKRAPFLFVGWFWYLIALAPVAGLIQIGSHARANRYTDLPLIGIYITLVFACRALQQARPILGKVFPVLGAIVFGLLCMRTYREVTYWRNSETLLLRACEVTANNYVAHNNLGQVYREADRLPEAAEQFRVAVEIRPDLAEPIANLGAILAQLGQFEQAETALKRAIDIAPGFADAHLNLGLLYWQQNQIDAARNHLLRACKLRPDDENIRELLTKFESETGQSNGIKPPK